MREGVRPDGLVALVDSNRPVKQHGIAPEQVKCEFAALGMTPVEYRPLAGGDVYFLEFRLSGPRPEPDKIKACPRS
jgi:hypothetical protein